MSGVSRDKEQVFRDTKGLAPAARHFIKNGYYTSALPGTKQYYDYWDEERQRCLYGYTPVSYTHLTLPTIYSV